MINLKTYLIISLVIIVYSGCVTKEELKEGIYEGLKTGDRITNPEHNDKTNSYQEKDIDYKEYKQQIEKTKY